MSKPTKSEANLNAELLGLNEELAKIPNHSTAMPESHPFGAGTEAPYVPNNLPEVPKGPPRAFPKGSLAALTNGVNGVKHMRVAKRTEKIKRTIAAGSGIRGIMGAQDYNVCDIGFATFYLKNLIDSGADTLTNKMAYNAFKNLLDMKIDTITAHRKAHECSIQQNDHAYMPNVDDKFQEYLSGRLDILMPVKGGKKTRKAKKSKKSKKSRRH